MSIFSKLFSKDPGADDQTSDPSAAPAAQENEGKDVPASSSKGSPGDDPMALASAAVQPAVMPHAPGSVPRGSRAGLSPRAVPRPAGAAPSALGAQRAPAAMPEPQDPSDALPGAWFVPATNASPAGDQGEPRRAAAPEAAAPIVARRDPRAAPIVAAPKAPARPRRPASDPRMPAPAAPTPRKVLASVEARSPFALAPTIDPVPASRSAAGVPAERMADVSANASATLLNEVEQAFDAMVSPIVDVGRADAPVPMAPAPQERAQPMAPEPVAPPDVRELFTQIAKNYMRPVREFEISLQWREATSAFVAVCEPAVMSLLRAAREMGLDDLCTGLAGFAEALRACGGLPGSAIEGDARTALLSTYASLARLSPELFSLEQERGKREAIIVHALLRQVPSISKLDVDRIYAAGLTSLDMMFVAKVDSLSSTTGIDETIAARVVDRFQRYRVETRVLAAGTNRSEHDRLARVCSDLRRCNEQYEKIANDGSDAAQAQRRELRRTKNESLLQIRVVLARLGEMDRIERLERLSVARKIEHLEAFLREAEIEGPILASISTQPHGA